MPRRGGRPWRVKMGAQAAARNLRFHLISPERVLTFPWPRASLLKAAAWTAVRGCLGSMRAPQLAPLGSSEKVLGSWCPLPGRATRPPPARPAPTPTPTLGRRGCSPVSPKQPVLVCGTDLLVAL